MESKKSILVSSSLRTQGKIYHAMSIYFNLLLAYKEFHWGQWIERMGKGDLCKEYSNRM